MALSRKKKIVITVAAVAVVAIVVMSIPWVALGVIRGVRAWRNPDTQAAMPGRHLLTRRYVDDQFRRPRDESELL